MRNLKKLLAVLVVVAVMATMFAVPVFAEDSTTLSAEAKACQALGMLEGRGDGLTDAYMKETQDRVQGALLQLRLYGVGKDAEAYTGTNNFSDAKTYAPWGQKVMAYLKDNAKYGWVGDNGKFMPKDSLTAQAYYKILLTSLGYVEGTDFTWANVIDKAKELAGLTKIAAKTTLTTEDVAVATVEGLQAKVKGGATTLIEKLVADKIFTEAQATASGLYSTELTYKAEVTGAAKITVTFSKAVDTAKATFTVKNGSFPVPVNATWDSEKKVATLTKTAGKFFAGDYTVTVGGIDFKDATKATATLKIADEALTSIEITSSSLYKATTTTATADYKVYNQYKEDITSTASISGVSSIGTVAAAAGTATVTKANAGTWTTTDTIASLTLYNGTVTVSKNLNIVDSKSIASLTLGDFVLPTGATKFAGAMNGVKINYTAKDQYGNDITLADVSGLTFIPNSYISGFTIGTDPQDVTKKALLCNIAAVTTQTEVTISAIVNATGTVATAKVTLYPLADVADFTLTPDQSVAKESATYKVWIDAIDQYGNPVAATDLAGFDAKFSVISTVPTVATVDGSILYDATVGKAYIPVVAQASSAGKSTSLVVTLLANTKSKTLGISFNAASNIVSMSAPSAALYFAPDSQTTFALSFLDQYGAAVTTDANYYVEIASTDDAIIADVASTPIATCVAGLTIDPTTTGNAGKSTVLTFTLRKTADDSAVDAKTVVVSVLPASTALTLGITDIAKVHGIAGFSAASPYAAKLAVTGKDASGHDYVVATDAIQTVTTSDSTLVQVGKSGSDWYVCGLAAGITSGTEASATINILVKNFDGSLSTITKTVTVNKDPIKAVSLDAVVVATGASLTVDATGPVAGAYKLDNVATTGKATFAFQAKDQFDKVIAIDAFVITSSNLTGGATATVAGDTLTITGTPAAGNYVVVTAITASGLSKSVKVVW